MQRGYHAPQLGLGGESARLPTGAIGYNPARERSHERIERAHRHGTHRAPRARRSPRRSPRPSLFSLNRREPPSGRRCGREPRGRVHRALAVDLRAQAPHSREPRSLHLAPRGDGRRTPAKAACVRVRVGRRVLRKPGRRGASRDVREWQRLSRRGLPRVGVRCRAGRRRRNPPRHPALRDGAEWRGGRPPGNGSPLPLWTRRHLGRRAPVHELDLDRRSGPRDSPCDRSGGLERTRQRRLARARHERGVHRRVGPRTSSPDAVSRPGLRAARDSSAKWRTSSCSRAKGSSQPVCWHPDSHTGIRIWRTRSGPRWPRGSTAR